MSLASLSLPVFILCVITTLTILLSRDWRWSLIALAVQYLGIFALTAQNWPFGMAVIKLVVGWMSGAALGTTMVGMKTIEEVKSWPAGRLFRVLASGLVVILVFSVTPQVAAWFPASVDHTLLECSMLLIMMGLLELGMTGQPFRMVLGLLTVFGGFEILYASLEVSILVAGLLASVDLGLALVGIYFISNAQVEENA